MCLSIGLCSSALCENWPCWRGQRVSPDSESRHSNCRFCESSRQDTRNSRLFQTTGEPCPLPGKSRCQRIPSPDSPSHFLGTTVSALLPSPRGPRQQGQFSHMAELHKPIESPNNHRQRESSPRENHNIIQVNFVSVNNSPCAVRRSTPAHCVTS